MVPFYFGYQFAFPMNETFANCHQTREKDNHTPLLLTERLKQLGYQCLSDSCDRFTKLRLVPVEIKRKEEPSAPPSE
jgi:hypothetical protein